MFDQTKNIKLIIIIIFVFLFTLSVISFFYFFEAGWMIINSIYPTTNLTLKIYHKELSEVKSLQEKIILDYTDKTVTADGDIVFPMMDLKVTFPESFADSTAIGHSEVRKNVVIVNQDASYIKDQYDNTYSAIKDSIADQNIVNQIKIISPQELYGWMQNLSRNMAVEQINQDNLRIIRLSSDKLPTSLVETSNINDTGKFVVDILKDSYLPINFSIEFANQTTGIKKITVSFLEYNKNSIPINIPEINKFGDFIARESVSLRTDPNGSHDYLWSLWEQEYFKCQQCVNKVWDEDEDGLTNVQEFIFGSNPLSKDSNSNNVNDYQELIDGKNPITSAPLSAPYFLAFKSITENYKLSSSKKEQTPPDRDATMQLMISVPKWAKSLTFNYGFEDEELSSYITVFFDGKLLYKITAIPGEKINYKDANGGYSKQAIVPMSQFAGQKGALTLILNSVGSATSPANFIIKYNLEFSTLPSLEDSIESDESKTPDQIKAQN